MMELNSKKPLEARRYILRDRDGDYVREVIADDKLQTCGPHIVFTKDRSLARVFSYSELWNPGSIAIEFSRGFSGGSAVRIK